MQTNFAPARLREPDMATSEKILRACVHCGFCTATCPTYTLEGDELDSPRGRIYLIKDMLEHPEQPVTPTHVRHIDRCLSCLSCMSTCPSGVHYMHLVDHARRYIEENFSRPLGDRLLRRALGVVLPRAWLFRLALGLGTMAGPLIRPFLARSQMSAAGEPPAEGLKSRLAAMLRLAPAALPTRVAGDEIRTYPAEGERVGRVAMLTGCAQKVLDPEINAATVRLLTRHGIEVVVAAGQGCCGALNHHLGQHAAALALVKRNIAAWETLDIQFVVVNASGCGTQLKDYGHLLRDDPAWASRAAHIASMARDVTEVLAAFGGVKPVRPTGQTVTYHSACSLQHGQKIAREPKALLAAAGFVVRDVPEGHLCCGSAGTYNLLQPAIATALRDRKLANIARTAPDIVAAGNIGCITQLASASAVPVLHTVQLLDWATGGPCPEALPLIVPQTHAVPAAGFT